MGGVWKRSIARNSRAKPPVGRCGRLARTSAEEAWRFSSTASAARGSQPSESAEVGCAQDTEDGNRPSSLPAASEIAIGLHEQLQQLRADDLELRHRNVDLRLLVTLLRFDQLEAGALSVDERYFREP